MEGGVGGDGDVAGFDGFVFVDGFVAGELASGDEAPVGAFADQFQLGGHGGSGAGFVDGGDVEGGFGAGVDGAVGEGGFDADEAGSGLDGDGELGVAGVAGGVVDGDVEFGADGAGAVGGGFQEDGEGRGALAVGGGERDLEGVGGEGFAV